MAKNFGAVPQLLQLEEDDKKKAQNTVDKIIANVN